MNPEAVGDLLEKSLSAVFMMSAPMLFVGLIVGVLISLFQAATQIQEVTLVFVPKIVQSDSQCGCGPLSSRRLSCSYGKSLSV